MIKQFGQSPVPWWKSSRIVATADGFEVLPVADAEGERSSVIWSEVSRIETYKRDLWATDLICLNIVVRSEEIEVNEEMGGWGSLIQSLDGSGLDVVPDGEWYCRVLQPPFATNHEVIFPRSEGPAGEPVDEVLPRTGPVETKIKQTRIDEYVGYTDLNPTGTWRER